MSVTKDYKTVTFSREESFAVVRGLRERIDELEARIAVTHSKHGADYLRAQLVATKTAMAAVEAMPFQSLQVAA